MNRVSFDPALHAYAIDDKPVLSVTQVLEKAGLIDHAFHNEYVRSRGEAVALAMEFENAKDLLDSSVAAEAAPYLDGYRRFLKESAFRLYSFEHIVASFQYLYAGKLDLYGRLNRQRVIIDAKTGEVPQWAPLQLAGYEQAAKESGLKVQARFTLRLFPNGNYRLRRCQDTQDWPRFLAALKKAKEVQHATA